MVFSASQSLGSPAATVNATMNGMTCSQFRREGSDSGGVGMTRIPSTACENKVTAQYNVTGVGLLYRYFSVGSQYHTILYCTVLGT
jgi:hypothetical protein